MKMNNPAINIALSEMEQNLKNLESARNQVNQVSDKSKEVIKVVVGLISSVENLKANYTEEEINLKQVFQNISNDLSLSFNNSINEILKSTVEYQRFHDEHIQSFESLSKRLNNSIRKASEKLDEIDIEKNYAIVKDSLDIQTKFIKESSQKTHDEIQFLSGQLKELLADILSSELRNTESLQKIHDEEIEGFKSLNTKLFKQDSNLKDLQEQVRNLSINNITHFEDFKNTLNIVNDNLSTELKSQDTKLTTLSRNWEEWSQAKDKEINQLNNNVNLVKNLLFGGLALVMMYIFYRIIR